MNKKNFIKIAFAFFLFVFLAVLAYSLAIGLSDTLNPIFKGIINFFQGV